MATLLGEDQKAENWSVFLSNLGEDISLFRLIIQRLNLDGGR